MRRRRGTDAALCGLESIKLSRVRHNETKPKHFEIALNLALAPDFDINNPAMLQIDADLNILLEILSGVGY
jgi:hypothetical protein